MLDVHQKYHRLFWQALKTEMPEKTSELFKKAVPLMDHLRKASAGAEYLINDHSRDRQLREIDTRCSELEKTIWSWAESINLGADKWGDQGDSFFIQTYQEIWEALEARSPFVIVSGAQPRRNVSPTRLLQEMEWRTLQRHIRELDAERGMSYLRSRFHRGYIVIKLPADGEMTEKTGMKALREEVDRQLSLAAEAIQWKEPPPKPGKRTIEHFAWAVKSICGKQSVKTILWNDSNPSDKIVEKAIREVKDAIGYVRERNKSTSGKKPKK